MEDRTENLPRGMYGKSYTNGAAILTPWQSGGVGHRFLSSATAVDLARQEKTARFRAALL